MTKEKHIQEGLLNLTQSSLAMLLPFGSIFLILLSSLDYFVTPENFLKFFIYRSTAAFFAFVLYIVFKLKKEVSRPFQNTVIIIATLIASTMVEAMILSFGGHQSPYYAGMIVVIVFMLGFLSISFKMTILVDSIAYAMYVVPLLLFDQISNVKVFINNNVFLLACIFGALGWRYFNQRLIIKNLTLEYDLSQDKKQLEVYSSQLKSMVEERTKELHESEQWHRALFENATDGIIVLDRSSIIVNANERACEMHGFTRESLIGTHIRLLEDAGDRDKMAERMRRILDGESLVFEARHNRRDGSSIYLEISAKAVTIGAATYIQSFYRDITEKKKFQEHLFQSQKMESIGVLAGGIAHDFNNILTAILGHAAIVRKSSNLDDRSLRSIGVIEDASRRAGRMISKLLGFSRKSKYELTPLNLNDVVYDTVKLLEQVIDKKISMTVELDNRLPLIQGDANQMEQVIMNFIVNSRDAMPNGGRISIKTEAKTVVRKMPNVPPYVPPGEYVVLSVTDTGAGIPQELVNKIFEPFFTTKEQGKGTGLGLSMVYGAVKDHQGFLAVQSTVGTGSIFTVYLPASPSAAIMAEARVAPGTGKETLLVVDDEEDILDIMREALESHGYKVFATSDATVALDIYRRIFHETALLITDIVMPRLDGKELIRQVKAIHPEVKVLAVSGYTKYVAEKEDIKDIDGFLQKPFESYNLLSVVRRILDAKSKHPVPF